MLKVKVNPVANNHFEIDTDLGTYFQSYATVVAFAPLAGAGPIKLDPKWSYSKTTMKYLNKFLWTSSKKEIEAGIKSGRFIIEELN